MKFEISKEDQERISTWLKDEVYPIEIARQRGYNRNPSAIQLDCWEQGHPYEGAIGGGVEYCFTPTSLGLVTIVKYGADHELNLTDYDSW